MRRSAAALVARVATRGCLPGRGGLGWKNYTGSANIVILNPYPVHHIPPNLHVSHCWCIVILFGVHQDVTRNLPDLYSLPDLPLHGPVKVLDHIHLNLHFIIVSLVVLEQMPSKGLPWLVFWFGTLVLRIFEQNNITYHKHENLFSVQLAVYVEDV